ncbi:MAG: Antibiotic biosynthesis monooxygenase [Acidimicrobiia bacterium]|nr:Antibiotic biosynthesis monooxygenase [Acidimicrobiia bacterium]
MTTLRIEHAVTTFALWQSAFDRFAETRVAFGVREQRVYRPLDDPCYVAIDLDFDTAEEAQRFLTFLQTKVWTTRNESPALAGAPHCVIHQRVDQIAPRPDPAGTNSFGASQVSFSSR